MVRNSILFIVVFFIGSSSFSQEDAIIEVDNWAIEEGKIVLQNIETDSIAQLYWDKIALILPPDLVKKYVFNFHLYTDGKDGELGAMEPLDTTNSRWSIEIDTSDMSLFRNDSLHVLDYSHTLIHEFGHILTINSSQVAPSDDVSQTGDSLFLGYFGYAKVDSYLNKFVILFWPISMLNIWDKIDVITNDKKRLKKISKFYMKRSSEFVTSYAADSPEEDIAESWTFFIFNKKPKATSIKREKVLFFYQFPELVEYRTHIRKHLKYNTDEYISDFRSASN